MAHILTDKEIKRLWKKLLPSVKDKPWRPTNRGWYVSPTIVIGGISFKMSFFRDCHRGLFCCEVSCLASGKKEFTRLGEFYKYWFTGWLKEKIKDTEREREDPNSQIRNEINAILEQPKKADSGGLLSLPSDTGQLSLKA